jgi:hypothetical protein
VFLAGDQRRDDILSDDELIKAAAFYTKGGRENVITVEDVRDILYEKRNTGIASGVIGIFAHSSK